MSAPYNNQNPYRGYPNQPQANSYNYEHNGQQSVQQEYGQYPPYGQEQAQQPAYYNDQQQQQQSYPNQSSQYSQNGEQPTEGERGLGGALTGGLAGAFTGHQANHGFLGMLGGAVLGSFAEDKLKKHKQKKEECQNPPQRPHSGQGYHGQGQGQQHGAGFSAGFSDNVSFNAYGGKN